MKGKKKWLSLAAVLVAAAAASGLLPPAVLEVLDAALEAVALPQ